VNVIRHHPLSTEWLKTEFHYSPHLAVVLDDRDLNLIDGRLQAFGLRPDFRVVTDLDDERAVGFAKGTRQNVLFTLSDSPHDLLQPGWLFLIHL